jgi:hypothetical protein
VCGLCEGAKGRPSYFPMIWIQMVWPSHHRAT